MLSNKTRSLLKVAERRAAALADNSYDDYHVPGLRYLCLGRSPELTTKIYLFEPGEWSAQAGELVVHPHDHAYDFSTRVLAGSVTNHRFQDLSHRRFGWSHNSSRWSFKPRVGFVSPEPAFLLESSRQTYLAGDNYDMRADEIHSISVSPLTPTVLRIEQRASSRRHTSAWFPIDVVSPTLVGLYKPMSEERYLETLARVRERCGL